MLDSCLDPQYHQLTVEDFTWAVAQAAAVEQQVGCMKRETYKAQCICISMYHVTMSVYSAL